jgi:hypothetical protein
MGLLFMMCDLFLSTDILMRLYQYGEILSGPISKYVKKKDIMFQLYDQQYQSDFL